MSRKTFKVSISSKKNGFTVVSKEKVIAFNQRLNGAMKEVNRDFQKKQKKSAERASKIILNA